MICTHWKFPTWLTCVNTLLSMYFKQKKPSSIYIGPRNCQKVLWKSSRSWWRPPWLSEEETCVFTAADQKPGQVPERPGSHLGLLHKSTFPATEQEGNAWCGRGIPCAAVMHSYHPGLPTASPQWHQKCKCCGKQRNPESHSVWL